MSKTTKTTGRIVKTTRRPSSANGNPRFALTLDDGRQLVTATDAGIAYAIENPEYVGSKHRGIPAPVVSFTLNARGYVVAAEPVEAVQL